MLEARGTPARRYVLYRLFTQQRVTRNRFRVDDADIASLRRSVEIAGHTGEDKDLGYATQFLGWALWLRGDLTGAAEQMEKALAMAERIGETFLRGTTRACAPARSKKRSPLPARFSTRRSSCSPTSSWTR